LHWVLLPAKERTTEHCTTVVHPQARSPFWLLKSAFEREHARLLPRLSWSWTVLLSSDTHRKLIISITAVLLPFLTYLLTPPRIITVVSLTSWSSQAVLCCVSPLVK
jgi:hypothetical protein